MIEDFEPQINSLTERFTAAETAIAAILGGVALSASARQLTSAQRQIAQILAQLLAEVVSWVEVEVPEMYRMGAQEAARSMILRLPEGVLEERLRGPVHTQSLQSLAEGLVEDMAAATEELNRDAKRRLREIGRRQLSKALANTNPVARVPDFRAEMEEHEVRFTDRSGRRWRADRYARMTLLTQTAVILNSGSLNTALEFGSPGVRVSDGGPGDVDEPCQRAAGQVWSVPYAIANPIEHPNCRRSFAPLSPSWTGELDREVA